MIEAMDETPERLTDVVHNQTGSDDYGFVSESNG
jgi:hypothetical protein